MKTMQLKDKVVRVDDNKATTLYSEGWQYVAKSVWKEKVRDVNKKEETKKTKKKSKKGKK
tara:strand:- start:209 stop:388 length:180 start_codon:yes stop_codon:yes gene_type:complete